MRMLLAISTFLVIILLGSFKPVTNPVYITGHIRIDTTKIHLNPNNLLVLVKGNHKILATTHTDKNGNFELSFTPTTEKKFKFYCSSPPIGTMLLETVAKFESDTPDMTFFIPRKAKSK